MGEPVVRAVNVCKSYGETRALDNVSITLSAGEVYGLVGPNGAGKTTFVRGVTGTVPVEGTVELFGASPRAVERSRIGVLPQSFAPASRLTVRELIDYYAGLYDNPRASEAVIEDVGLDEATETAYEALSGGQRRRLCVATALVNDPGLLVVDEPTTGIDPAGRRAVWRVIERLAADGTAVLLTSHSMTEIERLADRVGLLRAGTLVATGTPGELIAEYGGSPRLRITVGDRAGERVPMRAGGRESAADSAEHADRAATQLSAAGYRTTSGETSVWVENVEPTAIASVADTLNETVPVRSITWREPGLEDAYLRLTGEPFDAAGDDPRVAASDPETTSDDALETESDPETTGNDTLETESDPETAGDDALETGNDTRPTTGDTTRRPTTDNGNRSEDTR